MTEEVKEDVQEEEKKPLMNDHKLREVCAMYKVLLQALITLNEDDVEDLVTNPSWEMRQRMHPVLMDDPNAREAIGYLRATMHQLEAEWEDLFEAITLGITTKIENLRV